MKCKYCKDREGETKGICKNEKCDNYQDYVSPELECEKGEQEDKDER